MSGGLFIENLRKSFGAVEVLRDISLAINPGAFLVLLGESGCGKSTLLRLISGLEEEHEGTISIGGRDVTLLDPKDRNIAMVFQSYALYPHMSVFDNIAFGMRIRGHAKADMQTKVREVAEVLKLDQHLTRKPAQLSGGQRQRVAIGRAMVRDPALFLFDEPLSNLDAKLRVEMRTEIKRIHQTLGATIAYVTHDQVEAMTLADQIVLLNDGQIEQMGAPEALYMQPDTLFTARFIGTPEINSFDVTYHGGAAHFADGVALPLPETVARAALRDGQKAILAVRPEDVTLGEGRGHVTNDLPVEICEPMGSETSVTLDFHGQPLRLRAPGLKKLIPGDRVTATWALEGAHLFDPETGRHL